MVNKTEEKNRFQFTKTRLENIPLTNIGRAVYHDAGCANLVLTVSPASKVFYYFGRINGRPTRLALGKFSTPGEKVNTMTVEQARKACKRIAGAKAEGRDPAGERQSLRREQTLGALFTYWLETHAKRHKRTWVEDERQYKAFLKPWEHRKLSSVRKT
ncbi:MAG: Arm DNA-binding domain-containing protein, partial [Thermoguttaceae bacterium]